MRGAMSIAFLSALLFIGHAFAQSGTAIEIAPGITHYSGPDGGTLGLEVAPGITRFSGAVNGSAVQILPGITRYNFDTLDSFTDSLIDQADRDYMRRRSLDREDDLRGQLERDKRYQKASPRDREIMDLLGR